MAKASELPPQAQQVLSALGVEQYMPIKDLVDQLGWSETQVYAWLDLLMKSGWIESAPLPGAHVTGGLGTGYRIKRGVNIN